MDLTAGYAFYQRRNMRGLPLALVHRLRDKLRARQGRDPGPSACIADFHVVRFQDRLASQGLVRCRIE